MRKPTRKSTLRSAHRHSEPRALREEESARPAELRSPRPSVYGTASTSVRSTRFRLRSINYRENIRVNGLPCCSPEHSRVYHFGNDRDEEGFRDNASSPVAGGRSSWVRPHPLTPVLHPAPAALIRSPTLRSPPLMDDTLEVRWFVEDAPPASVVDWIETLGAEAETARTDLYLVSRDPAMNVKLREGDRKSVV